MENTNPKTFTNVRVFAGDKSKPAADASYRNLLWENFHVDHSFDLGAKIVADKEIGTIDSPFFRVSFDLIIHSLKLKGQYSTNSLDRSNVLNFMYENDAGKLLEFSFIHLHRSGYLEFSNFDGNINYWFNFNIELSHWYNIIIEQKSVNGKVI